jgi:ubiquinone/menaquinone biosynthesis C-methylase UbiE
MTIFTLGKACFALLSSLSALTLQVATLSPTPPSTTNTPSIYDKYAETYDALDGADSSIKSFGIDKLRSEASSFLSGSVLETCVGTALQSKYFDWSAITSYTGVDSSAEMLRLV